jgi:uncharacterized protein YdaU (DUF1376 family)
MNESLPTPKMEFDPVDFEQATGMFTDEEKYKYIRCLTFYWHHSHVEGIPNDETGLRELCHCDLAKWARLKGMIFDNDKFFFLENGKWHQKRARANYLKKQEDLIKKQAQTSIARTERTAQSVTKSNAKSVDFLGELSESPAYTGIDVKREFEKAKVWISLPQNKGRVLSQRFFVNWLNRLDHALPVSGESLAPTISPNVQAIQNQRNLDRYEARLKDLRGMKPINGWPKDSAELKEIKTLKEEIEKLKAVMNLKA